MDHQSAAQTAQETVAHGFGDAKDQWRPYAPDIEELRPKAAKYGISLRSLDGGRIAMEIKDPYGSGKPVASLAPSEIPSWRSEKTYPDEFLKVFRRFFDIRAKDGLFLH
jgi:hypothetical protein